MRGLCAQGDILFERIDDAPVTGQILSCAPTTAPGAE